MIDSKIFKAYDIRGIYPEELNEEAAYKIGAAFALFIKKSSGKENPEIVVGRDNRKSSDSLFEELKKGIIEQGANLIDIGLSTTPMVYFAVAEYNYDGGINVTASHNPKEYNGFKMVKEKAITLSESSGIQEIKEMAVSYNFVKAERAGKIIEKKIIDEYICSNSIPDKFDLKIVVDTANSVSGILVPEMFKNVNLIHLLEELNGDFPVHQPDPSKKENIELLQKKVLEERANLGIAFDGDGDRVYFVDEKGSVVPSDLIIAFISSIILRDIPGAKVLYDIRSSNIIRETVEALGGIAIPGRIGHSFIKDTMRREDIFFGAEYSGHYYLKFEGNYFEAPYFAVFSIMKEMKNTGKKLSQLIEPFRKYYHSGEINFKTENKNLAMERVEEKYKDGKVSHIDGTRIDFDDWWFSLRASNTEPLLRLVVESKKEALMKEKVEEIKSLIY
jgi:phosphomannomutase